MNSGDTRKHLENTLRVPKKKAQNNSIGVVDVNFYKPVIDKLFREAQGIIHMVNAAINPFLNIFGVQGEN